MRHAAPAAARPTEPHPESAAFARAASSDEVPAPPLRRVGVSRHPLSRPSTAVYRELLVGWCRERYSQATHDSVGLEFIRFRGHQSEHERREQRWRERMQPTHLSSASGWSSWLSLDGRRASWLASTSLRPIRSGTGWRRVSGTQEHAAIWAEHGRSSGSAPAAAARTSNCARSVTSHLDRVWGAMQGGHDAGAVCAPGSN